MRKLIVVLLVWSAGAMLAGCEADSDSELSAHARRADDYIAARFGVRHPDVGAIRIGWGARSLYQRAGKTEIITISEALRGDDDAIRAHMVHEIFHAISGLGHGDGATHYHGVKISDHIEGW